MAYRIKKKKWILYRHTRNFGMIIAVAKIVKNFSKTSITVEDREKMLLELRKQKYYKGRNPELPLDSINHRINTLAYYMFGYKDGKTKRFLFSPLGNLFLKHINNEEKLSKIFLTMLWGIQFQHPHGGADKIFNIYPFRLIFKLLSDERLENKLYVHEFAYLVAFIESIDKKEYDVLVNKNSKNKKLEQ